MEEIKKHSSQESEYDDDLMEDSKSPPAKQKEGTSPKINITATPPTK